MKKKWMFNMDRRYYALSRLIRIMKLTTFFLLISFISVNASVYSQVTKLDLKVQSTTVKDVLSRIEDKSNFFFMYNDRKIDVERKVDIDLKQAKIEDLLNTIFEGTNTKFLIKNRQIVLFNKDDEEFHTLNNLPESQQQKSVTGKVTDSSGAPLPGVSVVVKGTTTGIITDFEGKYTLSNIPGSGTLVFSFVGMKSQEIAISGKTTVNIVLAEETIGVDEVIVTGYQTQRRADLTGSVSVANMEKTKDIPTSNVLQAVQGKVAGLYVTSDGSPGSQVTKVNIRGINTLGNTNPLYVIDGVPTLDSQLFQSLDPSSIESMQVLKDASAASIYGSRASNGVIIITTKSGKGNKLTIEFKSSLSLQKYLRRYKMCNTDQYGRVLWQGSINDGIDPNNSLYTYDWHTTNGVAVLDAVHPVKFIGGDPTLPSGDTNWQDEVFRTGLISSNSLILTNSSEKANTMVDLSYFSNKGQILTTGYKKISLRINNTLRFFDNKLKVGENVQLIGSSEVPTPGDAARSVIALAEDILPILPVYKTDGTFAGPLGAGFSDRANPVHMTDISKNNLNNLYRSFGNIYAELTPIKDLVFKTSFGLDAGLLKQRIINPRWAEGFLSNNVNTLSINETQTFNWTWSNTLNYQLSKGKSRATFLLGMEAINNSTNLLGLYREGFAIDDINYYYISSGTGSMSESGSGTGSKLLSYFGKADYVYNDKYILSGTLRYDGSSRFGENNKYGLFPAVSAGWVISKEKFMQNQALISNLKLRGGFGTVGNQEIGDYSRFQLWKPDYGGTPAFILGMFGITSYATAYDLNGSDGGTLPSGYRATQAANPNLKWESTNELNEGVDFGFLNQKITGSFDYFNRKTKNILTTPPFLGSIGEGGSQVVNGATMSNTGWEFVLGYNNKRGDFSYSFTGNLSHFADKITYLPPSVVRNYPGNEEQTIIGHSVTSLFGYVTDGLFQNQAEVDAAAAQPGKGIGRIRYKDLNNDKQITPLDQTWLGNTNPKLIYGLTLEASYKNFSLSIFGRGVHGALVNDLAKQEKNSFLGLLMGQNKGVSLLNAWTPQNTSSTIPMLSTGNNNNEGRASDYILVNSSYFKVQSVQVSYSLPKSILDVTKVTSARVYLLGENLLLISDKKGANAFTGPDPETPVTQFTGYPRPVVLTFGIDITL
jgi:TonB-linked SusC/RagA family outer membrane protein